LLFSAHLARTTGTSSDRYIKGVAENQNPESTGRHPRGRWRVLMTVLLAKAAAPPARLPFANAISNGKSKRKGNRQFQHVHTARAVPTA
jgi:hypothetical protein